MRSKRLAKKVISLFAPLFLLTASNLSAASGDQLGKVNFPTTCSGGVQPTLEKGLALLHSFQYKESEARFAEAVTREPKLSLSVVVTATALPLPSTTE